MGSCPDTDIDPRKLATLREKRVNSELLTSIL